MKGAALLSALETARRGLGTIGALADAQLGARPRPGAVRFADGECTPEEVIVSVLRHQRHRVDVLVAALT